MALRRLTYFGTYDWGDAMHLNEDTLKVHGWKPYYFDDYQVAAIKLKEKQEQSPIYLLQNVEWQSDPEDMFFADAVLLGYVPTRLCVANSNELNEIVLKMYDEWYKAWKEAHESRIVKMFKKLFNKK